MRKGEKRPSWFKLFLHQKPLIDAVPDDVVGRSLKAALHYFSTGEIVELDDMAAAVFASLRPYIDESFDDFQRSVDMGRMGGNKRWSKAGVDDRPPIVPLSNPIGVSTEAEADAEADTEVDKKNIGGAKSSRRRFSPPGVDDVKAYCAEKGYILDAERFVDYYTSNGWRVGKNPMKDWKAAVRNWSKGKEVANGKAKIQLPGSIGTDL
jgi:hypothetical protein